MLLIQLALEFELLDIPYIFLFYNLLTIVANIIPSLNY